MARSSLWVLLAAIAAVTLFSAAQTSTPQVLPTDSNQTPSYSTGESINNAGGTTLGPATRCATPSPGALPTPSVAGTNAKSFPPPAATPFSQQPPSVSLGAHHSCILSSGGILRCFGRNDFGQLGIGTQIDSTAPIALPERWTQIDMGHDFGCAIDTSGSLSCWGRNAYPNKAQPAGAVRADFPRTAQSAYGGQLATGDLLDRFRPEAVFGGWAATGILPGQLQPEPSGPPSWQTNRHTSQQPSQQSIGAGRNHACGIGTDGSLWCWGHGAQGQLGLGATQLDDKYSPARVGTDNTWTNVVSGSDFTCAQRTDRSLWCWGSLTQTAEPKQLSTVPAIAQIAAGFEHACAIDERGGLWCWGANDFGQLGLGSRAVHKEPTRQNSSLSWRKVAVGAHHTCAIDNRGLLYCWGAGDSGQLGDGLLTARSRPGPAIVGLPPMIAVACGENHSCGLDESGDTWCWGAGQFGQLGNSDNAISARPQKLPRFNQTPMLTDLGPQSTDEDQSLRWSIKTIDPDNEITVIEIVGCMDQLGSCATAAGGTVRLLDANNGLIEYQPRPDFYGKDSLSIRATDGETISPSLTIPIEVRPVNDAPNAADASFEGYEDQPLLGRLPGSDVDGSNPQYRLSRAPARGTLSINPATGSFEYRLPPGTSGTTDFTYIVHDGLVPSNEAGVHINILPVNDRPVAFTVDLEVTAGERAFGLLSGYDPDGDNYEFALNSAGSLGTIELTNSASGAFTYAAHAGARGSERIPFIVRDGDLESTTGFVRIHILPATLPADPATVAPPLDPTITTDFEAAVDFLFRNADPIQTGADPTVFEPARLAVVRGSVQDEHGAALAGVGVQVLHHPEYGTTLTRTDGRFDLAVNGGGLLTLRFYKGGFLRADRQVEVPMRDYVFTEAVVLKEPDSAPQRLTSNAATTQAVIGAQSSDLRGERTPSLIVPAGIGAVAQLPDGSTQILDDLSIRITEYTVGENGPAAMPAQLPDNTAYTYCVELSIDEAEAMGADSVRFSSPVLHYVENFLNMPIGSIVPIGIYERKTGTWIPQANGRVVEILSVSPQGLAEIDIDGSGLAASAAELELFGIEPGEQLRLAEIYTPGTSLWRAPFEHFSPGDLNWPWGIDPNAEGPDQETAELDPESCTASGSIIHCQSRALGERIPLVGTPFDVVYSSERVPARTAEYQIEIPVMGARPSGPPVEVITVYVSIAGRRFAGTFLPNSNSTTLFRWDGLDGFGRRINGRVPVTVLISYGFEKRLLAAAERAASFDKQGPRFLSIDPPPNHCSLPSSVGELGESDHIPDCPLLGWKSHSYRRGLGSVDPRQYAVGGWTLDNHHLYDLYGRQLIFGDGTRSRHPNVQYMQIVLGGQNVHPLAPYDPFWLFDTTHKSVLRTREPRDVVVGADGTRYIIDSSVLLAMPNEGPIERIAGRYGLEADTIPQVVEPGRYNLLRHPMRLALDNNDQVYIAEACAIRRVEPDGSLRRVVGTGVCGFSGDEGPAELAQISIVRPGTNLLRDSGGMTFDRSGNLYIADTVNNRIRMVDTAGTITTIAGGRGPNQGGGFNRDTYPNNEARAGGDIWLNAPSDIEALPGGELAIADSYNNRILKIRRDGTVKTVAGNGTSANSLDPFNNMDALTVPLDNIHGLAADRNGNIYASVGDFFVYKISPGGMLYHVSGMADGNNGAGYPPMQVRHNRILGLDIAPDDSLYLAAHQANMVFRLAPLLSGYDLDTLVYPSPDGALVYLFDTDGRHLETRSTLNNTLIYRFSYDETGALAAVHDTDGLSTTIERDVFGHPTAIVGPYGARTTLVTDRYGYLTQITDPAGQSTQLDYQSVTTATGEQPGLLVAMTHPGGRGSTFSYDELGYLQNDTNALGGEQVLSTASTPSGSSQVSLRSASGAVRTYHSQQQPDEQLVNINRLNTPQGPLETQSVQHKQTATTITQPDGSILTQTRAPDPRFGLQAAYVATSTLTLPSGLSTTATTLRTAEPSNAADSTSAPILTELTRINDGPAFISRFDPRTHVVTTASAAGRTTTTQLNYDGRIIQQSSPGLADINYSYDNDGRVHTIAQTGTETIDGITTATERITALRYDQAGYLQSITDPLGRSSEFAYDDAGRITTQAFPDHRTVSFSYDPNSNLTAITPPGRPPHNYRYDQADQAINYSPPAVSESTATTYSYDTALRLTTLGLPDGSLIDIDLDIADRPTHIHHPLGALSYDYQSGSGRLASIQTHDGINLDYQYDGPLPTAVSWTGPIFGSYSIHYDNYLRPTRTYINDTYPINYTYDHDGLLTFAGDLYLGRNRENGLLETTLLGSFIDSITYNQFAEPSSLTTTYNNSRIYQNSYDRDALGRIVARTETILETTHTYAYTFDSADRLETVTTDGIESAHYTYDTNGNRLSKTTGGYTESGSYDDQDRLVSYAGCLYDHNPNGQVTRKSCLDGLTDYTYDVFGNLRQVVLPDSHVIEYLIDGQNRRIGRKVDGILVQGLLYQDQLEPIAELDSDGNIVSRFVYGSRPNVPDYFIKSGETYRIVADHLGSARLVIDSSGAVVQRIDYDEWGRVLLDTNPGFQPFGYAGGIYDGGTGLVRFGARDYDADLGRWLAKDPAQFVSGPNLYLYAENDPVNLIDTDGELPILAAMAVAGLVGAGIDLLLQLATNGGAIGCVSWGQVAAAGAIGAALPALGHGIKALRVATGPLKQWVRIGRSHSNFLDKPVRMSIRWGAANKSKYLKQIGDPTLRHFNQWLRKQKLPGNSWRVSDRGHFHLWE